MSVATIQQSQCKVKGKHNATIWLLTNIFYNKQLQQSDGNKTIPIHETVKMEALHLEGKETAFQ
jgi:hypothetical protein